jgi:hypothetical protein
VGSSRRTSGQQLQSPDPTEGLLNTVEEAHNGAAEDYLAEARSTEEEVCKQQLILQGLERVSKVVGNVSIISKELEGA